MAINSELSIVPDSTLPSSSPPSPMPSTPVIRRAARTYGGRPKDPPAHDDCLPSSSATSFVSRDSIYRTADPAIEEEIPPSSEPAQDDAMSLTDVEDGGERSGDEHAKPKYQFNFWKDLKALDERDDWDIILGPGSDGGGASHKTVDAPLRATAPNSPMTVNAASLSKDDVFSGSISTLTSSPSRAQILSASPPSPEAALPHPRVKKRSAVIQDSDSDSDHDQKRSSPAFPHPITTPKLRSSPTPPSSPPSHSDLPPALFSKTKSKGKGKDRGVPPLQFEESPTEPWADKKKGPAKDKRKNKVKAPTKKELAETNRTRQRIVAEQQITIPRESKVHKYTIQGLFSSIAAEARQPSSDPIQPFSSPGVHLPAESAKDEERPPGTPERAQSVRRSSCKPSPPPPQAQSAAAPIALDSDSDDLPEIGDVIKEDREKVEQAERQRALMEAKRRALAARSAHPINDEDSDGLEVIGANSEGAMHIVAEEEAEERKALKKMRLKPMEGRKRQLRLSGIGVASNSPAKKKRDPFPLLFGSTKNAKVEQGMGKAEEKWSQRDLNKALAMRVEEENRELTRKKEEEWVRRGGRVSSGLAGGEQQSGESQVSMANVLHEYVQRGLNVTEVEGEMGGDEEEDESDEEWTPEMRGSASPSPEAKENSNEHEDSDFGGGDVTMVNHDEDVDQDQDDNENIKSRVPRRHLAVLDSDSEDENKHPVRKPSSYDPGRVLSPVHSFLEEGKGTTLLPVRVPIITHRGSLSSMDEPTEDEENKENNTRLMYDKSEDKENKAVVRHALEQPPSFRTRDDSASNTGLSMSEDENDENENVKPRKPFGELLKEKGDENDDPFASQEAPGTSFAARLQRSSSSTSVRFGDSALPSTSTPPLSLKLAPRFGIAGADNGDLGFSQFDDEEVGFGGENAPVVPALQPGFAELFESNTQRSGLRVRSPLKSGGSNFFDDEATDSALDKLRKPAQFDELPLTLDVGLQPALDVSETMRRKAESIFEKEQAYVLEAAVKKKSTKPELYVNDHGFLTQTRPDVSSPEIYRVVSPSQSSTVFPSQRLQNTQPPLSTQRHPLRTLSISEDPDSTPDRAPLRRLVKRSDTPSRSGYRSSPSPSPQKRPLNAFDLLRRNPREPKKKLGRSEFVEAEAQESDDDEMLGFGLRKNEDDDGEDDGEDLDKSLDELVDDSVMDDKTLAEDAVLEKVKEHREEDDQKLEKLHKDAIEGKFRMKKRAGGVDMDDSDEEEDEDERNRRRRQKMAKRRRIEGDNLEELGQHEETRAFYDTYQTGLLDDDPQLAYLIQDVEMPTNHNDHDNDEGDTQEREYVSTTEIAEKIRKIAQLQEAEKQAPFYPNDVSWTEPDEEPDEHIRFKVSSNSTKQRRSVTGHVDYDDNLEHSNGVTVSEHALRQMRQWAKTENRSRNSGTGRSAVGAAVTGHGKKVKAGGGSLRNPGPSTSANNPYAPTKQPTKPLKARTSVLAGVADRSARFEQC